MMEIKKSHQWEMTHRHALTIEEQSAFLNYIASNEQYKHWLPMFTLFLGTGCRVGEIVGLRWEDCDFKQRIPKIRSGSNTKLKTTPAIWNHIGAIMFPVACIIFWIAICTMLGICMNEHTLI